MTSDTIPLTCAPVERRVLGAALRSAEGALIVRDNLTAADFTHPWHRLLFESLPAHTTDDGVDSTLLAHDLSNHPDSANTDPYLEIADLHAGGAPLAALDQNIARIKAASSARRLYAFGSRLSTRTLDTHGDPELLTPLIIDAEQELRTIGQAAAPHDWVQLGSMLSSLGDDSGALGGAPIPTGLRDVDELLDGGTLPGTLLVIAARPSQGKSTLGLDLARHAALRAVDPATGEIGIPGLVISLEMSAGEFAKRWLAAESGVNLTHIGQGLDDRELERVNRVLPSMEGAPLYVCDTVDASLPSILALISAAQRRLGIKWVLWDYAQLVQDDGRRGTSREGVVGATSRAFKDICRRLGLHGWLVAQLNRNPETRTDKKPYISDLRESGSLEQDADYVVLVHPVGALDDAGARMGEADLIVAKHRNGRTGTVPVVPQFHYARFANLAG